MQAQVKCPLTPYEFITFQQEFRKVYKVNAKYEELKKGMAEYY